MLIDVINVFVNGLVDVVLLWELFVSMLVLWQGVWFVMIVQGLMLVLSFVVVNEQVVLGKCVEIIDFLWCVVVVCQWVDSYLCEYVDLWVKCVNFEFDVVYCWFNNVWQCVGLVDEMVVKDVQNMVDFLYKFGVILVVYDMLKLFDCLYVGVFVVFVQKIVVVQ